MRFVVGILNVFSRNYRVVGSTEHSARSFRIAGHMTRTRQKLLDLGG